MSKIYEQIEADIKQTMKDQDSEKLVVLRVLSSDLKNALKEKGKELEDKDVTQVLKKTLKRLKDTIDSATQAGRDDLIAKAEKEKEIVNVYMPEQISDADLEKIVDEVLESMDEGAKANFGKVMGAIMARTKGEADGNKVSQLVKNKLEEQ
ncbi:MAG: GatB/YqeY domain-containing protein [bacterium]